MYGKLFERLVLGTVLTILDFDRVQGTSNSKIEKVFWLSDSADVRECDATIRLRAGKLARFDIGFIGIGNPEIVKDKLTRYASEIEVSGVRHTSQTFVIIDRMPKTQKTKEAADRSGTAIIQMSMQYWPRELARLMETKLGYKHELGDMEDDRIGNYLKDKITSVPIQDFLIGVNLQDINIDSGSIIAREERELYGEEEGLFDDE